MKKLLYLLSVAVLIWSCDKVDEIDLPILDEPIVEEENVPASTLPEVLYAYTSGDEEDSQTRTFVENTKVLWNGGDNIFYCAGNRIGAEYKYEGEDKATKAIFKKVGNGRSSEVTAAFPVGVFPYRDYFGATYNSNEIEDESDDTWTITPDFEKNQNYVPNSFDKDANIMIAVGNGEDNNLSFRSACGYVVVRLYGINVTVNEVLLYAKYDWGEPTPRIWGKLFDIEVDCNGNFKYNPGNPENGPMPNQVVLNCIDSKTQQGVRISEDPNNPTEFWFALPPVFLEKGFVLQIKDNYTNTQRVIKESTKSFEIERNKVKRMAAVDATNPARTNYLWYKTPAKIVKFDNFENSEEYFDAKIAEHSWDSSSSSTGDKMYYIKFDKPLTEIKAEAFKNTGVTEIILPETLTTIGESAFADNTELTTLSIPGRVTHIGQNAFANCTALESVTIEPSATNAQMTIGKGAFQYTGLTSLTIPSRVVGIEQEAFAYCVSLTSVTFESGSTPLTIGSKNTSVGGNHPFYGSDNIEALSLNRELVKAHNDVSMNLFKNHTLLANVTLGEQVKTIYGNMFDNTGISELAIPGTVTCIKENAFANCANLTKVTFLQSNSGTPLTIDTPNGSYYSNGEYNLFRGSNNIHTLYLYRELAAADEKEYMGLFEDHTGLTYITLGEQVKTIHNHMFYNAGTNIDKITIPSSVKLIEAGAFRECKVSNIVINESSDKTTPRIIEGSAFQDCQTLTSITIPEGVTTIDDYAFINCSSLAAITIPGTVTEIGEGVFKNCTSLGEVRFNPGASPLTIDNMDEVVIEGVSKPDRGPFYHSPLTSIYLDRNIVMTDTYAGELNAADEGIFSCEGYMNNGYQTTLTIGNNVTKILPYMFAGSAITSITIPANVTEIGYNAFLSCTKLSEVNISESSKPLTLGYQYSSSAEWGPFYDSPLATVALKRDINYVMDANNKPFTPDEMDEGVFATEYSNLSTINLDAKLTKILPYMFAGAAITSITIPEGVTTIDAYAFYECRSLAAISIPGSVTKIGNYVFYNCRSLSKVTFEDSETTLHIGYQPSSIDDVGPFWQSPLTEINIYRELAYDNDDVRTDEGLFANSRRGELVTKVDMGGHFRTILPFMFSYSAVGGTVVNGNHVPGSVWIPHTIKSIGDSAFLNCDKLAGLTMGYDGTTEFPSIGTGVFIDCDKFYYIKVRNKQRTKFENSTQWDNYESYIRSDSNFE